MKTIGIVLASARPADAARVTDGSRDFADAQALVGRGAIDQLADLPVRTAVLSRAPDAVVVAAGDRPRARQPPGRGWARLAPEYDAQAEVATRTGESVGTGIDIRRTAALQTVPRGAVQDWHVLAHRVGSAERGATGRNAVRDATQGVLDDSVGARAADAHRPVAGVTTAVVVTVALIRVGRARTVVRRRRQTVAVDVLERAEVGRTPG
jgi:hypothetical protein